MRFDRAAAATLAAVVLAAPSLARAETGDSDDSGPIIGFELGLAGSRGTPGESYQPGLGKALLIGWRLGRFALEWQFAQSYATVTSDPLLRADSTAGELSISTFTARYLFFGPRPFVWLQGGLAEVSVPLLGAATTDDTGNPVPPRATEVTGFGPVGGVAVGAPVPGGAIVTVEARGFVPLLWDLPRAYVIPGEAAGGAVPYTVSTDDVDAIAWSLTLGVRFTL